MHHQTLSQTVGLTVEYFSVDNPHDKLLKPTKEQDEPAFASGEKMRAVNSLRSLSYQTEFSVQDLQSIVSSVVEQKLGDLRRELKEPASTRFVASQGFGTRGGYKQNRSERGHNQNQGQGADDKREQGPTDSGAQRRNRRDIICTFCGKNNHVESRCWEKQRVRGEQQNQVQTMQQEN